MVSASGDLLWEYRHPLPPREEFPAVHGRSKRSISLYGDTVIFATLAEEFGLVGCITMLALYAAAIIIAIRIANVSHSHFGRLSAAGVTATFALYVLINGAMVMGLAPVVGVPMPLLSYGGTVMLTVMVGFGLVMAVRVHRYSEITSGKGTLL